MVIADYLNIIETFAEKNNIIAGVCHAAPMDSGWLSASPFVPFVSADLQKRTDPSATLTGVKSIIVIGVAPQGEGLAPAGNSQSGQLSSLGVDSDYHVVVRGLLRELVDELKTLGAFRYKILVDGSGLDERALAERAGLGFFGRNGLIISEKFGSRFNIGCVLTDLELPPNLKSQSFFVEGGSGGHPFFSKKGSPPENLSCPPDCNLCVKSCPTGALGGVGLDAARCISYLTQKEELSEEEEKMLFGQLYGCDICQNVCPFNKKRKVATVNVKEWIEMSDADFRDKYGHSAMLWRGTEVLKRNAKAILKRL